MVGRVVKNIGAAEAALQPLAEARRRFQALADAGDTSAERMASVAIGESGSCLINLGRLDEATVAHEEAIRRAEKLGDKRGMAVKKGELGTVRILQRRYAEALNIYAETRDMFESLGEPSSVATAWHQIGIVHREARQFEQAERAYRQALAIKVQQKDLAGEANSLSELGILYDNMGRLEGAVIFHRQAADINFKQQNPLTEGKSRSNLAITLIKLQRYDEARRELQRALECKQPYGHTAEPWKTWGILQDLEQATGNPQAAVQARRQAVQSYVAYRRAGGENQNPSAKLCAMVAQAIQQGQIAEAEQYLAEYLEADAEPWARALIPRLQAILHGARDPALAEDPELAYTDAVELVLLLEGLGA